MLYRRESDSMTALEDLRSAVSDKNEIRATAIHASGHVVAAWSFGFHVLCVSLDGRSAKTLFGIEKDNAYCLVGSSDLHNQAKTRGYIVTRDERDSIADICAQFYAGPYAEYYFNPDRYNNDVADGTWESIDFVMSEVGLKGRSARKLYRSATRRAEDFVHKHWDVISAFAAELEKKVTLGDGEIDFLLCGFFDGRQAGNSVHDRGFGC
jgi:hypothetical protein